MRTPDDAIGMRAYLEEKNVKRAVVVGGGFIGLEVAENLKDRGISVTVIDFASQLSPTCWTRKWQVMSSGICRKMGSGNYRHQG